MAVVFHGVDGWTATVEEGNFCAPGSALTYHWRVDVKNAEGYILSVTHYKDGFKAGKDAREMMLD